MTREELLRRADEALDETVALLTDLVRVPSINAGDDGPGHETDVCRVLAAKLAADGVESRILEGAPDRGNLVARIGPEGGRRLLYMSHTDVVPVEDAPEWRYPPFSGAVADGFVHGRGAADCKGLAAAGTVALLVLQRLKIPLHGALILAAGADEETGGRHGFGWLARQHPELVRADYAVNEGGGASFQAGDRTGYIINTGEKGRLEAAIRVHGRGGHAASPWAADNPIDRLAQVIHRLHEYRPRVDLSHPIYDAAREVLQSDVGRLLQVDFDGADPTERGVASALRGASSMTITPTMLRAGAKSNAIPPTATLTCDVRTLPGQTEEEVRGELARLFDGMEELEIGFRVTSDPSASPYPTEFSRMIEGATAAATGRDELLWLPGITSGFTDSRFIRPLGATVYGFAPQAPDPEAGAQEGIHGRDEQLPIAGLQTMLRMLVVLAWDVLGGT